MALPVVDRGKSASAFELKKSAVIKYDDALTSSDEIKKKIDSVGYKATSKQCDKG